MKILTRMDMMVGNFMDRVFKLSRSYQPVDLARILVRTAMKNECATLKRTFIPNLYAIVVSEEEYSRLAPIKHEIVADLEKVLIDFAIQQELLMLGKLQVSLEHSSDQANRQVRIRSIFRPEEDNEIPG
ncbi:MAG: DUF3662 domain-containing protein [Desulfarculaceae bacterium]|jgi:hypothetical protein